MKTFMTENEVNRVTTDVIPLALQKLPIASQDPQDKELAEHFLLRKVASVVNSRLDKIEKPIKAAFKSGANGITLSANYRRELSAGGTRQLFDLDTFIDAICQAYPDVMKHQLRELALKSKRESEPSTTIEIEYIGDTARG